MIELKNVTFSYYRDTVAIDDVSAVVSPGIHLLLGENGAGKTTLLRLLAGLLIPWKGVCEIDGDNISQRQPSTLSRSFFLPTDIDIPAKSINKFAKIHGKLYPNFNEESLHENLAEFGMTGDEDYYSMSFGMRHKAIVAYSISLHTDLLLLDEPANGLDIMSKKSLRTMLARNTDDNQTVIVSTHTVSDLRELYDGLIVLSHGKLLVCRPTWEISERIACVNTTIPPVEKLFMEQSLGLFHSLIINDEGLSTDLNYHLLYSALMSPQRDNVLEIINK